LQQMRHSAAPGIETPSETPTAVPGGRGKELKIVAFGGSGASILAMAITACVSASAAQGQEAVAADAGDAERATTFEIRAFQVKGNTLLPADAVERAVYPHMGPGRTEADVEAARAALQKAFEDRGYVAVSVLIPEQAVAGGILQLQVEPQAIGEVKIEGAKHPELVRAQAPSLAAGKTPNLTEFQRDVIAMNQKANRRVTPELRAGVAPGTLDVLLTVEESSAFHASAELNNFASAATTDLRYSGTLRYDDMWGRGDSLSVSSQLAPRRTGDGTVLSANYLARLGQGTQLMLYGVHSDSDIAVIGGTSVVGKGNILGVRVIQSLGAADGFYSALTLGIDWKDFQEDLTLGADTDSAPIEYFPATLSWRGDWSSGGQRSDLTATAILGIRGLGDGRSAFLYKRYQASDSFFAFKIEAGHNQEIGAGMQLDARLTGQWSGNPLISNEGFSLGGMSSVRGYYESESLGDYGVAYQLELRAPDLAEAFGTPILNDLRFHGFWDMGLGGIHQLLRGQDHRFRLMSMGVGGHIKLFDHFNGALDLGTPLISGPESHSGDIFARFRIWGEF